ncbi:uncharacterized protein LOC109810501 isoform X2 [Cajanus cajan]|uniref:uncharacterized protein LOC109810501 isoform X2 n=1 Tax=Cajanus cajan TaxID=3821 RepID=UPI0010FBB85C|nr:uncharacterized protein LOC109810501 isoform X2 [Cajanus cajan]
MLHTRCINHQIVPTIQIRCSTFPHRFQIPFALKTASPFVSNFPRIQNPQDIKKAPGRLIQLGCVILHKESCSAPWNLKILMCICIGISLGVQTSYWIEIACETDQGRRCGFKLFFSI